MKCKSVWKRMMAMFLSLAMVLTSGVFSSVDVKASWWDPTSPDINNDDGEAYGLVLKNVWVHDGVWEEEDNWSERRDGEWLPGNTYKVGYKAQPGADAIPVSANDLVVTYYEEDEVEETQWGIDPRFNLAENAVGEPVHFDLVHLDDSGFGYYECYPLPRPSPQKSSQAI